jgi:hypothetical protein
MDNMDPQVVTQLLNALLQPWHDAVKDPAQAQREVLQNLLQGYAQTGYGQEHGAAEIKTLDDYRRAFPVITYEDVKPLIQRVMAGRWLLSRKSRWVGPSPEVRLRASPSSSP